MSHRTPRTRTTAATNNNAAAAASNANGSDDGATIATATAEAPPEKVEKTSAKETKGEEIFNLSELKEMSISKPPKTARGMDVPGATGMRKQELVFKILAAQT